MFLIPSLAIQTIYEVIKNFIFFSIFSKFCDVRVKKFWNFFFFKLYFLLTRPILWLNSSSKTKFQLNRVTRRELGAILHSISWFVLSPSSQNMNYSINIGNIWPKKRLQIPEICLWYWCVDWNANRFDIDQGKYSLHFEIWISYMQSFFGSNMAYIDGNIHILRTGSQNEPGDRV